MTTGNKIEDPPSPHSPRRLLLFSTAIFFLAIGILVAIAVIQLTDSNDKPKPYHPITYPGGDQHVDAKVIHNGESVPVTAQRCSRADKPIAARGSYQWTSLTPGGLVFRTEVVTAQISPGCTTLHYLNPMPPTVVVKNRELFAQGAAQVQWKLQGSTFPVRPNGELGSPALWQTQSFLVLP